jgi:hypothetical protein
MIYRHIDGVEVSAVFATENNMQFRYRLDVALQEKLQKGKTACVVMQNPSYAGEDIADKSVQFMEKLIFRKEYPEFQGVQKMIVVNLFAYIQTNDFEGLDFQIGSQNDSAIREAMEESDIVILGWGVGKDFQGRKDFVSNMLNKMINKTIYKTKKHPSRGRYEGFILPFSGNPTIRLISEE